MSIMSNHLREVQAERDEYRNALRGLYGLVKLLYVGADDVAEIKRHLATNHRSLEAARVLGVTPIARTAMSRTWRKSAWLRITTAPP